MNDRQALERIRAIWVRWAKDETELAARIAEVLEEVGLPVIKSVGEAEES